MPLSKTMLALGKLGEVLEAYASGEPLPEAAGDNLQQRLDEAVQQSFYHNGWFDRQHVLTAFTALAENLREESLMQWVRPYRDQLEKADALKTIGVVMAGNIPLVGFHDFLAVLISGHRFYGKLSAQDQFLLPLLSDVLVALEPGLKDRFVFTTQRLETMDAVIATGSNNASRYFEYYFGKYPHIIRGNRHAVAVLTGEEPAEQLAALGTDIFTYYGLGCRNVSKLFVPAGYAFEPFFEATSGFAHVLDNKKYANNYHYNRSVFLMNLVTIKDNGFLLLKEEEGIGSPVGVLHYETYRHTRDLWTRLEVEQPNIQCIVGENSLPFGATQRPSLWDYADGKNTLEFLLKLS